MGMRHVHKRLLHWDASACWEINGFDGWIVICWACVSICCSLCVLWFSSSYPKKHAVWQLICQYLLVCVSARMVPCDGLASHPACILTLPSVPWNIVYLEHIEPLKAMCVYFVI